MHALGLWSHYLIIYEAFVDRRLSRTEYSMFFVVDCHHIIENPDEPDADWMAYLRFRQRRGLRALVWKGEYQLQDSQTGLTFTHI